MSNRHPFYEKFIPKQHTTSAHTIQDPLQSGKKPRQKEQTGMHNKKANHGDGSHVKAPPVRASDRHREQRQSYPAVPYRTGAPVFSELTPDAKKILERFPDLLQQIVPLDAKKRQRLPQHIHTLFHELTDERGRRKVQYLNNPVTLSAYMYYYVWWNLVRLTKLLQNIDIFLENGDYAADFGSGPLTFICALWIAKPELRKKQLTWYCVDISNRALNFGEELFLALCASTGRSDSEETAPWRIKKICGAFGTPLTEKVAFAAEANMFNEMFWNSQLPLNEQAEKVRDTVMRYLKPNGAFLFIEPGIPLAGEFLSLIRARFLQDGFFVHTPCPHHGACCLPHGKQDGVPVKIPIAVHKWCHFTFDTDDSPQNLLKLSEASNLGKERASLSFLYCSAPSASRPHTGKKLSHHEIPVRICSDIIMLDPHVIGRYACSEKGFMLLTNRAYKNSIVNTAVSGTLLLLPIDCIQPRQRDKKTGALLVCL